MPGFSYDTTYTCFVCGEAIADDPHTYHAEGCPQRDPEHMARTAENCVGWSGCGEDVHAECCPTCTGQAF